jgi:nitroreductase
MSNETIQTILKRRSVREYDPTQLTDEELDTILEAGKFAPTGAGAQPWHFSVVQNTSILESINAAIKEMYLNSDNPRMVERASVDDFSVFYNGPTVILVSADESAITPRIDSAMAMENMFLAAASIDIGSCWVHGLVRLFENSDQFCGDLCIPEGYKVFAAGVFGHPAGELPEPAPRREGTVDVIR